MRALKAYLASEGDDLIAIARGRQQIAEGQSHDADDVLAELEDQRARGAAAQ